MKNESNHIIYNSFKKYSINIFQVFQICWLFLLQFKKSWNFHSYSRSENEKRSASTQKIIKNLKNQKIFINIFKKYGIFWVDALFHLFSDRLKLCFSQQKATKFVLEQMVLVVLLAM